MGKGDKKTKRGKIIQGSYGIRRRRKKADKPGLKPLTVIKEKDKKNINEVEVAKEVKPVKENIEISEGSEIKVAKEKAVIKAPKVAKEKKEVKEENTTKGAKPKKEKKS